MVMVSLSAPLSSLFRPSSVCPTPCLAGTWEVIRPLVDSESLCLESLSQAPPSSVCSLCALVPWARKPGPQLPLSFMNFLNCCTQIWDYQQEGRGQNERQQPTSTLLRLFSAFLKSSQVVLSLPQPPVWGSLGLDTRETEGKTTVGFPPLSRP